MDLRQRLVPRPKAEEPESMGLGDSVEASIGKLLTVTPFYGWGWDRMEVGKTEAIDVPYPFQLRLTRVWHWHGERRGGVGRIETAGHQLDGQWVVFGTRHEGTFDFSEHIGHHNITIYTDEPLAETDGWPHADGAALNGYGEIREAQS
jgi:hypothetical protein